MNVNEKVDAQLLKRYVEGNASPEESVIVKQWFADENLKRQLFNLSVDMWEKIPPDIEIQELDGSRILDRIHHRIKREESVFSKEQGKLTIFLGKLSRVAAILLLPALLTTVFLYHRINTIYSDTSYSEIYAPAGTRTTFHLPDGSTGWLNGGSALKFPSRFQKNFRNVELIGEAYFHVTPGKRNPFIVSTFHIDVKVHGTSFNVMAYADEPVTEVTLESGSVEVFKKMDEDRVSIVKLKPDQSLSYNQKNGNVNLVAGRSYDKTAWIEGKLVFRYEPLSEVINKINRWYNVNIQITDPELKDHIYYGTFQNETLEEALKLLQLTAPIRYRDMGRKKNPDGTFEKRIIELQSRKK